MSIKSGHHICACGKKATTKVRGLLVCMGCRDAEQLRYGNKTCLCGKTAVRKKRGDWACQGCLDKEEYRYGRKGKKKYVPIIGIEEHRVML